MSLQFTENRQRNVGLSVSTNPRTVLRSNGLAEATQAEAIAGTIQHRYISPLRLSQVIANEATGDLTKVDDTNVTLTLGGTPTDALWNDVSITVGWSGTLSATRGGWGTDISAQSGIPILTTGVSAFFSPAAGVQTFLTTPSSANLATAVTDETGSGALVFANTPTLVTPILGTPTSGTLTNCTGLPVGGVSGLGTGVATALAVNVGSAGAFVAQNGALGTPSSGTLTNCTGYTVANLSGAGAGVLTFLATPSSANLISAVTDETGTGALVFGTAPTISGAILSGTTNVSGGQLAFPASQSASSNANTLDDYEEGTWTPTLTYETPGTFAITYLSQYGKYTKIGRGVFYTFTIQANDGNITPGTASGEARIPGLPFTPDSAGSADTYMGCGMFFQRITKANYTQYTPQTQPSVTYLRLIAAGSGQAAATVTAADMPTGTFLNWSGAGFYWV